MLLCNGINIKYKNCFYKRKRNFLFEELIHDRKKMMQNILKIPFLEIKNGGYFSSRREIFFSNFSMLFSIFCILSIKLQSKSATKA